MPIFTDENQILMNEKQFELATKGTRICQKNINAVKRVLVDQLTRQQVQEEEKITKQKLSRLISSLEANYKKNLAKNGLLHMEVVVPEDKKQELEELEAETLKKHL